MRQILNANDLLHRILAVSTKFPPPYATFGQVDGFLWSQNTKTRTQPMKLPNSLLGSGLSLLFCASTLIAQGNPPPPSPPPPHPAHPPHPAGGPAPQAKPNHRPLAGGKQFGQRGDRPFFQPLIDEAAGRLSPEEWKELRTVMARLWENEEVKTARDKARDSAMALRDTIRKVAVKEAASLAPVIEKLMMRGLDDQPPGPGAPAHGPEDHAAQPHAPKDGHEAAGRDPLSKVGGMLMQMHEKLPPEQREQLHQAMRKIRERPEIRELAQGLMQASPEERRAKMRALVELARKSLHDANPELAKALDELRDKKGDHSAPDHTPEAKKPDVRPAGDPPTKE